MSFAISERREARMIREISWRESACLRYGTLMSALGHKPTSQPFRWMSALPPKTDIGTQSRNVRFVAHNSHGVIIFRCRTQAFLRCRASHSATALTSTWNSSPACFSTRFMIVFCSFGFRSIRPPTSTTSVPTSVCLIRYSLNSGSLAISDAPK